MISFLDNIVLFDDEDAAACAMFERQIREHVARHDKLIGRDRLAAMTCHRDTHDASITPRAEVTAKPAPAGIGAVAGFGHRLGLPRA